MYKLESFAKLLLLSASLITCHPLSSSAKAPTVTNPTTKVSFRGNLSKDVESFLNIRFGQDTGGANRFAHPQAFVYPSGTEVDASAPGAACPQPRVPVEGLPVFENVTNMSEDCLTLRIDRPANTTAKDRLPVMVWIYGGGDTIGQIYDPAYDPTGLVLNSAAQGTPAIYVAMNYRVGVFGFAATPALNASNSLNSGLLDQRLALKWVQEHIGLFGGDLEKVTIFGESDGATGVGLQITAYGGESNEQPLFQQAIMESGGPTADPGVNSNLTAGHTAKVIATVNCTSPTSSSSEELACLRALPLDTLLAASVKYEQAIAEFGFDVFIPVSPSPFIPDAPSKLLRTGRFARDINVIIGWNENDGSLFVPTNLTTDADTSAWLRSSWPGLGLEHTQTLLDHYPSISFAAAVAGEKDVTAQYFRASRMERDVEFTCPSLLLVQSMAKHSTHDTSAYFFALNASLFESVFAEDNTSYYGVSHFSDIPFVFNQASAPHFDAPASLKQLAEQISGSWAAFATHGDPVAGSGNGTLRGWDKAGSGGTADGGPYNLRILGGPHDGDVLIGTKAQDGKALYDEDVLARCAVWNSEEVLAGLAV